MSRIITWHNKQLALLFVTLMIRFIQVIRKGRKYSIVSATERKSRITFIEKVTGRTARAVKQALLKLLYQ